ncbi:hypothetical protein TNCV_1499301 [Trichonephila clavipes]|nr:hypothetical protein TNCV_1499301 [Trichonephila clavipes]
MVVKRDGCQLKSHPRHLTMVQNVEVRRQKLSNAWSAYGQKKFDHDKETPTEKRLGSSSLSDKCSWDRKDSEPLTSVPLSLGNDLVCNRI